MNIYKRQMQRLGLSVEQYAKLLDIPVDIIKKLVNGGEVVENMGINDFLRRKVIEKYEEVEKNKEAIAMKVLEMKAKEPEHKKVRRLKELFPNDKILNWYLYEFDKDECFRKYHVAGWVDLMRRYNFYSDTGRCQGKISDSTVQRVMEKLYDEVGVTTIYEVAKQLYDCFVNGNIANAPIREYTPNNIKREKNYEDNELVEWYKNINLKRILKDNCITNKEFTKEIEVGISTGFALTNKTYIPSTDLLLKVKKFVDKYESIEEPVEEIKEDPIVETIEMVIEEPVKVNDNDMLKELLKARLTQEEIYLIELFGGRI